MSVPVEYFSRLSHSLTWPFRVVGEFVVEKVMAQVGPATDVVESAIGGTNSATLGPAVASGDYALGMHMALPAEHLARLNSVFPLTETIGAFVIVAGVWCVVWLVRLVLRLTPFL